MGFELLLCGTRSGPPKAALNPFTGQPGVHTPIAMNDEELLAARAVLARHGGLDDRGGGLLKLPRAQLQFSGFDAEGDIVKIIGELGAACEVLFELATAGHMAIEVLSADDDGPPLVTTPEAQERSGGTLVHTVEELVSALEPHHRSAMAYTRSVT